MTTHHRTTRALAAAGLALTIGGAQASARPIAFTPEGSQPATRTVAVAPRSHVSEPTIVRVTSGNGGFDWGDAGIGAAGGLALSMLAVGGGLLVTERRRSQAAAS